MKLQGFVLAGFIAGVGGAMYGHSLSQIGATSFPVQSSIDVVVMTVIGGVGMLFGPFLGAAVVQGATFLPLDAAGLAATALGLLIIILYLPGGLGSLVAPVRDRAATFLARRAGIDRRASPRIRRRSTRPRATGTTRPAMPTLPAPKAIARATPGPAAHACGACASAFGGVDAVAASTSTSRAGETLGLIGPNGAGKTTTFELLAASPGPTPAPSRTSATTSPPLTPEARGRLGLIRSFQDAALFPTMTVQACVRLSLERVDPTRFLPDMLGLRGQERRKAVLADGLVDWMGLDRYRDRRSRSCPPGRDGSPRSPASSRCSRGCCCSTNRRRASPSARPRRSARCSLRLKSELDLTLIVIEHDIPLDHGSVGSHHRHG